MMADLRYLLAIYVHAHRTGNSVPPHIDAEARWHLGLPVSDGPAVPSALVDTHYEWELKDVKGEWQAGGSSNSQRDVEREGMRYLQTYAQDGPHKLIIRQHTTQTINEITNG